MWTSYTVQWEKCKPFKTDCTKVTGYRLQKMDLEMTFRSHSEDSGMLNYKYSFSRKPGIQPCLVENRMTDTTI